MFTLPTQPADLNVKIWRYMDFTKFIAMLEHDALFFTRLDELGDPFEAFNGIRNKALVWDTTDPVLIDANIKIRKVVAEGFEDFKQRTTVSCWHMNDCESALMWTQYGKSADALCIESTYSTLRACLDETIRLGIVDYDDANPTNHFKAAMHKTNEYRQEQEIRAFHYNASDEIPSGGRYVKVDLGRLITQIYVAPNANPWFGPLVKQVIERYGLKKQVAPSTLDDKPFF